MSTVSRWIAPAVLAAGLGMAAMSPTTAHAQVGDNLVRVVVDVADVVLRSGTPYYRNGGYGYDDRLIMERDRYGRPVYYREVARQRDYRSAPPYGNASVTTNTPNRQVKCNKHGAQDHHYDARHDRDASLRQPLRQLVLQLRP
jgi:hypothetical protein